MFSLLKKNKKNEKIKKKLFQLKKTLNLHPYFFYSLLRDVWI